MQGQIQIMSQIMNYMRKLRSHGCQKLVTRLWNVCLCFLICDFSVEPPFFIFFFKEHYECLNTSDLWSYIFNWGSGKILTVFCKCFEKSEDGTTCCFHDRDHKDDASLAFAPRWSSLVIVFFNNTLLLLPSWWPLVTDRALEHHYLINIFNRPVCLSFLPSGHNYNSQLTRRKRA